MTYKQTINYLYGFERFGIQFGLERITYLLSLLDNPQDSFKSIHIAGTNGKGSTSSFIASILKEAGFKTGLYTSPHLVDFRERIQINGVLIPRKRLTWIVERLMPLIEETEGALQCAPTYFEVATAIAFEYFKQEKVDFACIEVGMGGRLDATNVINSVVSVITSIGFDHTKELGNTLGKIAYEKAGIIKENGILVCGVTDEEPLDVIKKMCLKNNARMYLGNLSNYDISLLGEHQIRNASLAVAVCEILEKSPCVPLFQRGIKGDLCIRNGLKNARWPGRFEVLRRRPTIILDGAHNPDGASELFKSLKKYFPNKKINFVFGILKDKDMFGIVKELVPLADKIIVSSPNCDRASSLDELAEIVRKFSKDVETVYPIRSAIKRMVKMVKNDEIICITGSLYTVGEARKILV